MRTVYILKRSEIEPEKMIRYLLTPSQKMLYALYKAGYRIEGLKEWGRRAKVGTSQVYNHMRILEKLGYIIIDERGPREIIFTLTERGAEVARVIETLIKLYDEDLKKIGIEIEF